MPYLVRDACYVYTDDVTELALVPDCREAAFRVQREVLAADANCEQPAEPFSLPSVNRTYCLEWFDS